MSRPRPTCDGPSQATLVKSVPFIEKIRPSAVRVLRRNRQMAKNGLFDQRRKVSVQFAYRESSETCKVVVPYAWHLEEEVANMRSTAAMNRVEQLLIAAEDDRRCFVPANRADAEVLRRGVKAGKITRPFPGMYLRQETWDRLASQPRVRWRFVQKAYLMEHPGTVFCSFSAALEYGLWVSKRYLDEIHVVAPPDCHGRKGGQVHRHQCPQKELTRHKVADVTTVERTVLDCTLTASFEDGLAIADSAVRFMNLDKEEYGLYVAHAARNRSGATTALRVARYMDGGPENGGESIVRGRIIELGYLPPTSLQVEFIDPIDGSLIRVDMYYELPDGSQLIVEVDGKVKYVGADGSLEATQDKLLAERNRESHISKLGIPVMRVQFNRVYEEGYLEHLLESFGVPKVEG